MSTADNVVPPILHEHPDVTGGWLRPAVFGASDGLVSNAALIAGVAGGTAAGGGSTTIVVLAGLAGLASGAFSMAAGEYISVASQSESAKLEIAKERREILENPAGEIAELAETYVARGVDPALAKEISAQVHRNIDHAVAVHAREEFGVDLENLASPWLAAGSSFAAFALGALVPVLPYLFGLASLVPAMALALLALFGCGAVVTQVTDRRWWYGGLRQVFLGAAAAALTYGVGTIVGVAVG